MFCTVNPTLSNTQGQLKYVLIRLERIVLNYLDAWITIGGGGKGNRII